MVSENINLELKDTGFQRIMPVDIRNVFYEKNPGMARLIPGFIFRYIEKIAHQKDINDFLAVHGDKQGMDFVKAAITDFNVSIEVRGEENIPGDGRYIFVANHPLGGFDGLLFMEVLSRYYKDFKFLVNDILMTITNLNCLFIPVNKHGKQGYNSIRQIEQAYNSNAQILTFPSGFVSRYFNGMVMDLAWKKNFITSAVRYGRDVVPVYFTGRNTNFFYRLFRLRKFLGLKANIEMLYLVDETWKHKNKNITITFGKKIPYTTFDKSKTPAEWAKWVKKQVYSIGGITDVPL